MHPYDEVHFIELVELADNFVPISSQPSWIPAPGLDFIAYYAESSSLSDNDEFGLRHSSGFGEQVY